jgi:hypothetical protein
MPYSPKAVRIGAEAGVRDDPAAVGQPRYSPLVAGEWEIAAPGTRSFTMESPPAGKSNGAALRLPVRWIGDPLPYPLKKRMK